MPFLGAASSGVPTHAGDVFPAAAGHCLPCCVSQEFNGHSFAVWGDVSCVYADGQGALLTGRIFHPGDIARELGQDRTDGPNLLLQAYRRWGTEFPRHVEGEYAFALWDGSTRRLLLGRDPSGQWPLFYMQQGNELRFANQIGHLLAWPGMSARPDESYIAHWLALIPTGNDSTFFENIFTLPVGKTLLFENGRTVVSDSWQPEQVSLLHLRDPREYAEGLREVLHSAIQDRLQFETVVASELSGGLDSSTVVALVAMQLKQQGRRMFAFTAVPEHAVAESPWTFANEGPHAASVAAMYPNVDHRLIKHGQHSTFSLMDRFSSTWMTPIVYVRNLDWSYEIALQARQSGASSLFTGAGGNLTISYDGTLALPSLFLQGRLREAVELALCMHRNEHWGMAGIAHHLLRPWIPEWVKFALNRFRGHHQTSLDYSLIQRAFAQHHGLVSNVFERFLDTADSTRVRIWALRRSDAGMPSEVIRQLCGISRTDPTSDRRVMEYCLSVPVEHYFEKGVPRSLIRNATTGLLPEHVRNERRRGLQAADFSKHFLAERQEALDELARIKKVDLAVRTLDLPAMENILHGTGGQRFSDERPVNSYRLMRGLSLGRFLRRLEDGSVFTVPEAPSLPNRPPSGANPDMTPGARP